MSKHNIDEQISEIPENILFAIASMTNPTVEGIRRKLPGNKKPLAEELLKRHQGTDAEDTDVEQEGASESTAAEAGQEEKSAFSAFAQTMGAQMSRQQQQAQWATAPNTSTASAAANETVASAAAAAMNEVEAEESAQPEEKPANRLSALAMQAQQLNEDKFASLVDENDFVEIGPEHFAEFEYSEESKSRKTGIKVRLRQHDDSLTIELTWDKSAWQAEDGVFTLFRVLAANQIVECSPDAGEQIVATQGFAYAETPEPGIAVRHYQVWAYMGRDLREIIDSQPYLVGEGLAVLPLEGVELQPSEGLVEGNWNYSDQYSEVQVFASPANSLERADSEQFRLQDGVTAYSFKHPTKSRGQKMRYAFQPRVKFRDTMVAGKSIVRTVDVQASLQVVKVYAELDTTSEHSDQVSLAWRTPPAGVVRIYFTKTAPTADLSRNEISEGGLVRDPAIGAGRKVVEDPWTKENDSKFNTATWPSDWTELYITPVTVLGDRAVVGKTEVLQRVGGITDAKIVERTSAQLVTFAWPQGADVVRVEVAPRGSEGENFREHRAELDRERYARDGGVRLNLAADGQNVLLTPLSTFAGKETASEPTVLDYRGLAKYYYSFYRDPQDPNGGYKLFIWREGGEDLNPPRFSAVYHPLRFPLSINDANDPGAALLQFRRINASTGEPLDDASMTIIAPESLPGDAGSAAAAAQCFYIHPMDQKFAPSPGAGNWIRLFITDEEDNTARPRRIVLDTDNELPSIRS